MSVYLVLIPAYGNIHTHILFKEPQTDWNRARSSLGFLNVHGNPESTHFVVEALKRDVIKLPGPVVTWEDDGRYNYFVIYEANESLQDWKILQFFAYNGGAALASNKYYVVYGFDGPVEHFTSVFNQQGRPFEQYCHRLVPGSKSPPRKTRPPKEKKIGHLFSVQTTPTETGSHSLASKLHKNDVRSLRGMGNNIQGTTVTDYLNSRYFDSESVAALEILDVESDVD